MYSQAFSTRVEPLASEKKYKDGIAEKRDIDKGDWNALSVSASRRRVGLCTTLLHRFAPPQHERERDKPYHFFRSLFDVKNAFIQLPLS